MIDPLVGTAVAHYEVLAKLGGGGMGVVYTARNVRLGQIVALKFLPPQWSHDESARQRFVREAQAASATQHRNICTIHDIETTADGRLFIVMAYYEGQTLKQKLEGGALPIEEAVEIAAQVAEGLAKAHAEGVVHRDIKPGNLMVCEDDIKILDFGLAKFANSLQLTLEGSTLGTVAYMSPEQARGEEADARSDIWAVGVVLYEMLTGTLPFKGAYPEAISHAIRKDPVPPVHIAGRDVPPELTRIIERALAKDPAERIQSARELARDLRLLQGRTIPLDLLTAPINAPPLQIAAPRRWWRSRAALVSSGLLVIGATGAPLWLFAPVDRVPVVVAPVVNQSGYAELDPYRAALTQELIAELADSPAVRVLPYDRELQILRRFRAAGQDISSREALQALTTNSGARVVVVPTLLYENGAWRARVEFRDAATATNAAVEDTPPVVSSLIKDTAYGLIPSLTAAIDAHFVAAGPRHAYVASRLRSLAGRAPSPPQRSMRSLDAAAAFAQGIEAYDQLEYANALSAFTTATAQDARNPLLLAWRSRVASIMRHDTDAADSAQQAIRLTGDQTPPPVRLFVEAVAAESRRDFSTAAARYSELAGRHDDDVAATIELAAYEDRRLLNVDAIRDYVRVLSLGGYLVRPHVELCRLYNRSSEAAQARDHAQRALTAYRAAGDRAGEAQALLCVTDTLRVGSKAEREEGGRSAAAALEIFEDLRMPYNTARAQHYVAMAAQAQGHLSDAAGAWEHSLASARSVGNVALQTAVLTNLGVTYTDLGKRDRAVDFYEQSYKLNESLGNDQAAAYSQANVGALLIDYGGDPEKGVRDVQNALTVVRKLGDKNFEIFCLQKLGAYYRYAGRVADAERELNQAMAIARERNRDVAFLLLELGRGRFDTADYARAADLFTQAAAAGSGDESTEARIHLARTWARVGDFAAAQAELAKAKADIDRLGEPGFAPLFQLAWGELAYESGRIAEARMHFQQSSAIWTDAFPDEASVEARAHLALLDSSPGAQGPARTSLSAVLEQAHKMGRLALEARARINLARLDIQRRTYPNALAMLRDISVDGDRTLGPELQAQVHYWRAQAHRGAGDVAEAAIDLAAARKLLDGITAALPARLRAGFAARPDIAFPYG